MKKSIVKNGIIINDIVKMEWSASGYVETKKGSFTCASQEYNSSKFGTIAVFFTSDCAFVWAENGGVAAEDFWSVREMKNFLKTNYDLSFPTGYDQFLPIIQAAGDECDAEMLDRFGLAEFKTDIEERMADVAQFSADVEA